MLGELFSLILAKDSNSFPRFVPSCLTIFCDPPKPIHEYIKHYLTKCFQVLQACYWRKQNNPIKYFLSALIVVQQHSSQAIPFSPNSVISHYQLLCSCHCCWLAFVQESRCQFTVLPCISQGKSPYNEKILKLVIQACPRSSQKLVYLQ